MSPHLFFDAAATGHHGEFLENVICGLAGGGMGHAGHASILAHPSLRERLMVCKAKCEAQVDIYFLSSGDLDYLRTAR